MHRLFLNVLALAAVLVAQSACVTTMRRTPHGGTPGHYGYSNAPVGIDSPSATCRNSLSACVALYGKVGMYRNFIAPLVGRIIPWLGVSYD
jgi:hypothetical protein